MQTTMRSRLFAGGGLAVLLAALVAVLGCEDGDGTSALTVTPGLWTLTSTNTTVQLVVDQASTQPLSLPLEWSVADAAKGTVVGASGYQASYVRTSARGIQVVTVKDQFGAVGSSTITQE